MALPNRDTVVRREHLEARWEKVGCGGFGQVYKARHKDWGFDVAVKILKKDDSHFMCEEAKLMDVASCEFVLRMYGLYLGPSGERGLVMEHMKRGSIESLQRELSGPPPWPLALRLAHQTAVAMNFLHMKNIVHQDLKPNNVLLNDELNARLADFGLSTVVSSSDTVLGGTFKYMPPEAFGPSYEPVRAFDVYSYGIFLWSLFTGKEPYSGANYSRVELRIPEGDRPPCEELLNLRVQGVTDVVDLMKRCWVMLPSERPTFIECLKVTENLFSRQSHNIRSAVDQVLTVLDSQNSKVQLNMKLVGHESRLNDFVAPAESGVKKASSGDSCKTRTRKEKAWFVDHYRPELIQRVSQALAVVEDMGHMVHGETYSRIHAKQTKEDKIRTMYLETLKSGGEKVKVAFYDALKKHEPFLMEELEDELRRSTSSRSHVFR